MDSDKSLIDSLLKLDVSGTRSAGNEASNRDDTRSDRGNEFTEDAPRFRRISDPHQPPGDTMNFTIMPPGVAGIDNKSENDREYVRSPPRYNAENGGEYVPDAFAMGAVARFREVDDPKGIGGFSSSIAGDAVHMTRSSTQSRDGSGDASPYSRDYAGYDSRSRSRSSSNPATRDLYVQPPSETVPVGGPNATPRTQDGPYMSQHGYTAPNGAIAQQGQPRSVPAAAASVPRQQGSYQVYAPDSQYAQRGGVPVGVAAPPAEPYYGAGGAVDPYAGYKPGPYGKPYPQPYRPAPNPYDPYGAGYGAPPQAPVIPGYPAPRYGKPMAGGNYPRPPYGARDDPAGYYGAPGAYAPAPQAGYGYAAGYGAPPVPLEDPYYGAGGAPGGAAAVNRALGRPDSFRAGGGAGGPRGAPGGAGYGSHVNVRLRDRALPVAEPVNLDTVDPSTVVYQVQFKKTIRNYVLRVGDMTPIKAGDFVVVQADRGEDLGVVTESFTLPIFLEKRFAMRAYMDEEDQNVSYILRLASPAELKLLPEKFQDEEMIFKTCENLALHTYRLPMSVVDVEYQFDRHKITIFYDSPVRVDFRELVRDLFSSFKARIWMKKINQFHQPDIKHYAAMALATGVQFAPSND